MLLVPLSAGILFLSQEFKLLLSIDLWMLFFSQMEQLFDLNKVTKETEFLCKKYVVHFVVSGGSYSAISVSSCSIIRPLVVKNLLQQSCPSELISVK